jgi:hypothetical protein
MTTQWQAIDDALRDTRDGRVICDNCNEVVDVQSCHLSQSPEDSQEAIVTCWQCLSEAESSVTAPL